MNPELITDEILDLEKKLAELKKIQLEHLQNESKKVNIHIFKFNPLTSKVRIKLSKFNTELVDHLRFSTDRIWDQESNLLSIGYLKPFLDKFPGDDYRTITWEAESFTKYQEWISRSDCHVSLDSKKPYINVVLGPRLSGRTIHLNIDISSWSNDGKGYRFALAEFYLFPQAVESYLPGTKVTYSDEALVELTNQLNKRRELSELANAKDWDIGPTPFTGINPNTNKKYELKPEQKVAIAFIEKTGGSGIIAYDMGLGKTAVAIALAERHPEWKRVLFITPAGLKTNWAREIFKFTGKKAVILEGIEPDGLAIDAIVENEAKYFIINYDIIGRETGEKEDDGHGNKKGVMKWVELLNVFKFDYIALDEYHYIKNLAAQRSIGARAINYINVTPMSGTPIVNRPSELWPGLNIINKDIFSSPTAFTSQFTNPDGTARNVKKLHEMLSPYMIRRTIKDIYGDTIHVERIPFSKELSPKARVNYKKILEGIYISLRRPDYQTNVTSILAELIRCKQTSSADNIQASADLAFDAYEDTEKKVIIFSQFKDSQYGIESILGRQSAVINGEVKDERRYELIDKFQDPKSDLKFIITNILEGLTLTAAHTVIFNDIWWTPKDHKQAEGRAFGRTNDPHGGNSYWIENEGTIDQFLNALIIKKTAIFNEVIDGVRDSQEETKGVINQLLEHLRNSI